MQLSACPVWPLMAIWCHVTHAAPRGSCALFWVTRASHSPPSSSGQTCRNLDLNQVLTYNSHPTRAGIGAGIGSMQAVPWTRRTPLTVASACSSAARPTAPVRLHRKRKTGNLLLANPSRICKASLRSQPKGARVWPASHLLLKPQVNHRRPPQGRREGPGVGNYDSVRGRGGGRILAKRRQRRIRG